MRKVSKYVLLHLHDKNISMCSYLNRPKPQSSILAKDKYNELTRERMYPH